MLTIFSIAIVFPPPPPFPTGETPRALPGGKALSTFVCVCVCKPKARVQKGAEVEESGE